MQRTRLNHSALGKRLVSARALPIILLAILVCGCSKTQSTAETKNAANKTAVEVPEYWPKLDLAVKPDPQLEKRVAQLLSSMTLEQKVAQMIQPEIGDFTVADMRRYGFGSYLNGGGSFPNKNKHASAQDWINLAEAMYQASIDDSLDGSTIPTMWGTDAVHGHNNVIGATLFPHNIGLGAANDPALIKAIARATAQEVMVTGIDWVFAPTVAVVRDDRWGRTYEGYSEDPEIVRRYSAAIVTGLQGDPGKNFLDDEHVIATVKHFLGDGGTENGDDQGNNLADEKTLFDIHAQGYISGVSAGAQTVMASFNSWHGIKNHGNPYLLTEILKKRMGFDGFVVGDWNGHGQVKGCNNQSCAQAVNAGLDMFMVPGLDWKPLLENTIAQVKSGAISMQRIDDAVSRILRVKLRAGLFAKPSPAKRQLSGKTEMIGFAAHRLIARQAVRESLVLLKNKAHLLPLPPNKHFLITGDGADNIGKQSGGWSITWQGSGNSNDEFPGATSIYAGIKTQVENAGGSVELTPDGSYQQKPDVAIVVYGEEPYAEGNGDIDNLDFQRGNKKDLALLQRLKTQNIPVVSVFISGRPLWINAELNASDSFVAAWLPGTEGAGIADVLLRKTDGTINYDFRGKLSFSWPAESTQTNINRNDANYHPLLPYGFGLTYQDDNVLADNLSEVSISKTQTLPELNLFNAPWRPALSWQTNNLLVTSNHASNPFIEYHTIDRNLQEDARLVHFSGKAMASVELNDNFPFDLRGYYESNASLSLAISLVEPFDKSSLTPIFLSMRCESHCNPEIDITSMLSKIPPGEWQDLSIDLACFANRGATMDKIVAPFVLKTAGEITVKYSAVKIIPNHTRVASVVCAKNE